MVEINTRFEVKFQDKPVLLPKELIAQYDGQRFLKLRPTNQQICQLICGSGAAKKNASLSSSTSLQDLLNQRNHAWGKASDEGKEEEGEVQWEDENKSKKRKAKAVLLAEVVEINVGDTVVQCLMQGKRPTRTDLCILMEEQQLLAVFTKIAADSEGCLFKKRAYLRSRPGDDADDKEEE